MTTVYSLSAFLISCALCPLIIKFCDKKKIYDEVDARKIHTGNIPRLGGIALFFSFIVVSVVYTFQTDAFSFFDYWQIVAAFFIIFFTGLLDDFFDLYARLKFILQIIAALFIAASPFYFTMFLGWHIPEAIGRAGVFFWVLVCINAFNLIDGLDWLCSGISIFIVLSFAISGFIKNLSYYPILFILAGSIAGFMVWNRPDAKIFLGDSGSTTLGFLIALVPMLNTNNPDYAYSQIFQCCLVSAIPTIDVVAAIIRRTRDKRSLFSPDRAHLHHKLLNMGFSKISVLVSILSVQFFISLVIVFSTFASKRVAVAFISIMYLFVIGIFIFIHYANRKVNMMHKGHLEDHPMEEKKFK